MALTYDQVEAITHRYYMPKLPQLVFDQSYLLQKLMKKGTRPDSGERILQPLMYQFSKGGAYRPYEQFDVSAEDQVTAAEFNWKYYEVPITISRDELLRNQGSLGVKKLMDAKMKGAGLKMHDLLSTDIFAISQTTGDSAKELNSLDNMCNDASNNLGTGVTYGGISKSTYSWWAGKTNDFGGAGNGVNYANMNSAFGDVADGSIIPDCIVSHNNPFYKYMESQQVQQRFVRSTTAETGFNSLEFNGVMWAADLHASDAGTTVASNRIYLLNTDFIDFVIHKDENNRLEPFQKPWNQAVGIAHIMWAGELTGCDPSRQCVARNFDSTSIA